MRVFELTIAFPLYLLAEWTGEEQAFLETVLVNRSRTLWSSSCGAAPHALKPTPGKRVFPAP